MAMPLTTIAVAMIRWASILLPGCQSRNVGEVRLRIKANMSKKTGRLAIIVEARDTEPFSIARRTSAEATTARISVIVTKPIVDFIRFRLLNSLKVSGRIEMIKKIPDKQSRLIQSNCQGEI